MVKDRLHSYKGSVISYDSNGYPTYYNNKNYIWNKGKLSRIYRGSPTQGGATYEDCTFTYDAYGRRLSKSYTYDPNPASTSDYSYTYNTTYNYDNSGRLVREYCTERYVTGTTNKREFIYIYDESGMIGVLYSYNGSSLTPYYYHRNLQGDVIGIYDANGTQIVKYSYDAWGNCTVAVSSVFDLANNNPIRYRGYYYDRETKLYYLNARYYNPEWRRFISPDDTAYLDPDTPSGLNLYAYCNNDPVNYADPCGHSPLPNWAKWLIGGAIIVGLGVGAFFAVGTAGVIFGAAFYGAVTGAVSSALIGGAFGAIAGGWEGFLDGASSGFMTGALIGGIMGALTSSLNIISGAVVIEGKAQATGYLFHRFASNVQAGKFAIQIGRYSKIGLDCKLKKVGMIGTKEPDVMAVARFGNNKIIEVVSKTQTIASQQQKINVMLSSNPGTTGRVISWALQHWFYF